MVIYPTSYMTLIKVVNTSLWGSSGWLSILPPTWPSSRFLNQLYEVQVDGYLSYLLHGLNQGLIQLYEVQKGGFYLLPLTWPYLRFLFTYLKLNLNLKHITYIYPVFPFRIISDSSLSTLQLISWTLHPTPWVYMIPFSFYTIWVQYLSYTKTYTNTNTLFTQTFSNIHAYTLCLEMLSY
jgi:hypothetical protein